MTISPGPADGGNSGPDNGPGLHRPPPVPRWVKVSGAIVAIVVLLLLIALLAGVGGDHGPGRHDGASGEPQTEVAAGTSRRG